MKNIILLEKENAFNHMRECIKTGHLGSELLDMARQGVSHGYELLVGPVPGNSSSPESGPRRLLSLLLPQCLCPVVGGGGGLESIPPM
jgi:hypothetical protein